MARREDMVIGMDLYEEIRQGYITGESQRSMARRLGVSRQTVKKYCQGATMPGIRKSYQRTPTLVTDEVLQFIQSCDYFTSIVPPIHAKDTVSPRS